jgi:signal transduction histidine kinase
MNSRQHPDAIDTRLVFRVYAWITITSGMFLYLWPLKRFFPTLLAQPDLAGLPFGRYAVLRTVVTVAVMMGIAAVGFSRIDDPPSQRRALIWFAWAHLLGGIMFFIQWDAIFSIVLPWPALGLTPLAVGVVLFVIAATSTRVPRLNLLFKPLAVDIDGPVLVDRVRQRSMESLRSQYEQHIRQAARIEERARLARDLHDAVKQQLFAIQTSAATAQERFTSDASGALKALDQVRASARDAMTEMEALINQLQAAPLENTGLVSALKQHCEALALRTGADVQVEIGTLPPSHSLAPGAPQALLRAAQEALANVAKHARAHHVKVRLGMTGDNLELSVTDDGVGFEPMAVTSGMGLANMLARIGEFGGTRLVHTKPGRGTTLAFSIPCDASTAGDYARKAFLWGGASVLLLGLAVTNVNWTHGWYVMLIAVVVLVMVTAARFAAAWHRVRQLPEGLA